MRNSRGVRTVAVFSGPCTSATANNTRPDLIQTTAGTFPQSLSTGTGAHVHRSAPPSVPHSNTECDWQVRRPVAGLTRATLRWETGAAYLADSRPMYTQTGNTLLFSFFYVTYGTTPGTKSHGVGGLLPDTVHCPAAPGSLSPRDVDTRPLKSISPSIWADPFNRNNKREGVLGGRTRWECHLNIYADTFSFF